MKITIAGGHGKIALLLSELLAKAGHTPVALIRNPDHEADVRAHGAEPLLLDLEKTDVSTLVGALRGSDAVVFAAGAGPDSGPARKLTVDRDGAILLATAAHTAGVPRVVVISSIGSDDFDPDSDDEFQIYLRAKSEADAAVRALDLDWTVVRPGGLTDDPATGRVEAATSVERGSIPRADVAAVIADLIGSGRGIRSQFEVVSGSDPIDAALARI